MTPDEMDEKDRYIVELQDRVGALRELLELSARRVLELETLTESGLKAFNVTRQYVGEEVLPEVSGWDWFEWCESAREALGA